MSGSGRLLRPFMIKQWPALLGAVAATVFATAADLAQPWPIKLVLDYILENHRERPFALGEQEVWLLALVASFVILIAIMDATAVFLGKRLLQRAGEKIVHDLRVTLYAHLQRLSLAFHERRPTGDLVTRVTGDVNAIGDLFADAIGGLVGALLLLAGMCIVCLLLDPVLTLATFAITPTLAAVTFRYRRRVRILASEQRAREGRIASLATEALRAMRVVKAFGAEGFERERVMRESAERLQVGITAAGVEARFGGMVDVLGAIGAALVLVLGVFRVASGALTPGDLVVFVAYVRKLYSPLKEIAKQAAKVSKAMARADRIAEILNADQVLVDRPGAYTGRAPDGRGQGTVDLQNVTFAYEPGRAALDDFSLHIPAGTRIAIVGRSGAGKSTLGALIARFYDPTAGRVLIDGRDARDCALAWLRSQVGLVLQDTMLFAGSVAENIGYGIEAEREAVIAAAKAAGADAFIRALPQGYDTLLGPEGVGLSGGQRQRLAIARTLLRNPPILVLDEPTTGLDAESEAQVMDGLRVLMQGRTTILITHALALACSADRIVVLENGRIVQDGRPEELLTVPGPFRHLAAEQGLTQPVASKGRRSTIRTTDASTTVTS